MLFLIFYINAEVYPVFDREYYDTLLSLLAHAKKEIIVAMFEAGTFKGKWDAVYKVYENLIKARKRGVSVKVLLEFSNWNERVNEKNFSIGEFLKRNGIKVYYDNPKKCLHCKFVVVDSIYTLVGSSNWGYYALMKNSEANVLIKSKEIALLFIKYFYERCK